MIPKFGIFLLGVTVCFLVMYFVNTTQVDSKIKELKLQNDSLYKANIQIDSLKNMYVAQINEANYEILKLESEDNALQTNVNFMNRQITIIKKKYEKANNYANSFGSDDIKRYFAELK